MGPKWAVAREKVVFWLAEEEIIEVDDGEEGKGEGDGLLCVAGMKGVGC